MVSYGTSAMIPGAALRPAVGDEAYAGARNFETLERVINRVLGHTYVCPTHNTLGAVKLLRRDALSRRAARAARATRAAASTCTPRAASRSSMPATTPSRSSPATSTSPGSSRSIAAATPGLHRRPVPSPTASTRSASPTCSAVRALADRHGPAPGARPLAGDRERLVHPAPRAGHGRPHDRRARQADRQDRPRRPDGRRPGPALQHRRLPRHRQPRRPRALHQRSGGLRGAAHLRRHGRADDGGARPRPRRDDRRGRGAVGDAPDRALHRQAARRRDPARARLRRRLPPRRRVPAAGRRAPPARARLRALPDLGRARPRPGAGRPRPPAAGRRSRAWR